MYEIIFQLLLTAYTLPKVSIAVQRKRNCKVKKNSKLFFYL